ncbi:blastomere cadherin-like isoform X1 [Xiphophorus maculatus]|uniref:Blastomere cadherin-like n=1 Tax=Xiphophorus maculatus TaxID=8083 RepID=A0A3B5QH95_XIPMA|nr:blastomere cadherin-like isoform X1 [Xiphophorus maculatus]
MGTIWFPVWCALFLNVQASPAGHTEDQICEPEFDSESVIFKVTEKHLRPTTIVGKVNFTDCTDVTRLIFTTYDSHFYVETDGTVTVSRWLVLQEGQRRFDIHSWDSKGKKRTVSVVVQYQGDHDAAHSIQSDFPLKDITNNLEDAPQVPILYFPKSNSGLKRRKRFWVVPPLSVSENHRGPYPLALARIRSDIDKVKMTYYRITGPGADEFPVGLFTMDRNTGHLYVTQELDREKQDKYMFQVHAVVDGSAPAEEPMEIIVNVIDQNDNKPVFTFLGNVAESSSIGSEVMKVTATDADEPNNDNSQISYRIVSQEPQQPNPSMFVINPTTGAISVNAAGLDRQKYPEYTLEVKAADMNGEGHSALTKVIISVTPGTELPVPVLHFPSSSEGLRRKKRWIIPPINIAENSRGPFPLHIAQIRSEADKIKKIHYKITGPGADQPPVGLFTMDRDTGHLYVTQELDREKKDRYEFQVHAVVDGSAPAEEPMEIIVNVIDQNDNKPVFTFLGNVAESSSIGSEVMKVTATDADEPNNDNSQISYRIVSQEPQQPNPSMFVINPTTGAIRVNAAGLDRQKYPEYTLEVKAADMNGEGHSALTKVIISVTPGTELPAAQGGGRSRRDADLKIHHSSSEKMFLNLLPLPSEEGMRRRKRSWVIPPLSVPENSRGPFPLKLAQVRSDRSQVTKIIYRLRGPGADQPPVGLFIIDSDSGWLEVTQELDRENQDKYRLEALAVEEGQAEASESIEIIVNVIDQNDNKPVFSRDTFKGEVPQSSAKGFEVMTVQATDPDEENSDNSDVCYRIIRQEPEEPNPSMFAINTTTGLITVDATGLDREKHPQYTLTVVAADMKGEGLMGIAKVILTITDSSSPTGWVIPDITVPENGIGPFPLQLAQIRFNEDETKKILYSISGPGADQPPVGLFTMDGDTGHLYVTQGLDRENQNKYTLQVNAVAEDGGATVGQTQAVVKVTDQNNNKPVFNKDTYEGEVPEASPIGFEVIKVEATDADEPNTDHSEIRYSIISQEPAEPSMFTIDPVSGAITLSTDGLNREKHPQYTLLVRAEDSAGKGSTTLFEQVKVILTVTANSASMSQAGEAKRRRKRFSTAPLSVMEK